MSWPQVAIPLGSVLSVRYGKASAASDRDADGRYPVVGSAGEMARTHTPLALKPAIVIGRKGNVGQSHYFEAGCWPTDTTFFVEPGPDIDPRFLLLQLEHLNLRSLDRSTATPSLRREDLEAQLILLPLIPEQRRIVAVLEEHLSDLDGGLRTLANVRAKVDLLEGAILQDGFRAIEDAPSLAIASLIRSGRRMVYGVLVPGEDIDSGVPMIRVGDIGHGTVGTSLKRISPDIERRFVRSRVEPGDLLLSVVGTIGRVAVVPEWARGFNVARAVSVIPLNDQIHPEFARLALQRPSEQRKLVAAAHEVARKTLNLEDLRRFTIPAPPLAAQEKTATTLLDRLSACERTRGAIDRQAKKAGGLRRAVLEAAFSGRLSGRGSDADVIEEVAEEEPA